MAIAFTSITPVSQNCNGKLDETIVSFVVTGTYSAGGTVLTAAQKAVNGVRRQDRFGRRMIPLIRCLLKYNTTTGALQLFTVTQPVVELGAVSGAGTYVLRIFSVGSSVAAPPMS
jgi:hypothetical protein